MTGLIRSEIRKIFTTRLWWGLLIGLVLSWAALSALTGFASGRTGGGALDRGLADPAVVRSVYTGGLSIGRLFALAFGVIAMAGEYSHQTITATTLASPRRSRVVLAKLVVVALAGLGYGLAGVLSGVASGAAVVAGRGFRVDLVGNGVPRALLTSAVAVALWAVIGLGVGTLLRNQIVALLLSIGLAWIAEPIIALVLNVAHAGDVAKYLPSQATDSLVSPPTTSGDLTVALLPWWGGALVLLAYAALSGGLGARLTLRRDIT